MASEVSKTSRQMVLCFMSSAVNQRKPQDFFPGVKPAPNNEVGSQRRQWTR